MNCVRELRIKKGIQQKELAISLGVSQPTVSDWENGRKNPRGENLKKLAEYFNVDEQFILGYGMEDPNLFIPENPKLSGVSETEQIIQHVLDKLGVAKQPRSREAILISGAVDRMSQEQRDQLVAVVKAMFSNHPELFEEKGTETDET